MTDMHTSTETTRRRSQKALPEPAPKKEADKYAPTFRYTWQDVYITAMKVWPTAQRQLKKRWMLKLASKFDIDMLGTLTLSYRDGVFWIIDGQHRIRAFCEWNGDGWEKLKLTCKVYTGMTVEDEAEMYLELNSRLNDTPLNRFLVSCTAERSDESTVLKAVEDAGLVVEKHGERRVTAVVALMNIYARADAATITRALRILYLAMGEPALDGGTIDGMALVCERYRENLIDGMMVTRLGELKGGINRLKSKAEMYRAQLCKNYGPCMAAAIVDTYNAKGAGKLGAWWKE